MALRTHARVSSSNTLFGVSSSSSVLLSFPPEAAGCTAAAAFVVGCCVCPRASTSVISPLMRDLHPSRSDLFSCSNLSRYPQLRRSGRRSLIRMARKVWRET